MMHSAIKLQRNLPGNQWAKPAGFRKWPWEQPYSPLMSKAFFQTLRAYPHHKLLFSTMAFFHLFGDNAENSIHDPCPLHRSRFPRVSCSESSMLNKSEIPWVTPLPPWHPSVEQQCMQEQCMPDTKDLQISCCICGCQGNVMWGLLEACPLIPTHSSTLEHDSDAINFCVHSVTAENGFCNLSFWKPTSHHLQDYCSMSISCVSLT